MSEDLNRALLAILRAESEQLNKGLLRTSLIKYAYLLDVLSAQAQSGKPWLDVAWRFVHYGPFSSAVAEGIDGLAQTGLLNTVTGADRGSDRDFTIYKLSAVHRAPALTELGLPTGVALLLSSLMRKFQNDLAVLLNHVYFHTAPMRTALPGRSLDFSGCEPFNANLFRPIAIEDLSKRKLAQAKAAIRAAVERRKEPKPALFQGPFDEIYFLGMAALAETPPVIGLSGHAKISVDPSDS